MPKPDDLKEWLKSMVDKCREYLLLVLPFEEHELKFLERINPQGEIVPVLLTQDEDIAARISQNPHLLWKSLNIRRSQEHANN